jgi:hypothetical protein
MPSLFEAVTASHATGPITRAMYLWDGTLTEDAVRRVHELELRDIAGDRSDSTGRLRGSLLGSPCKRQQVIPFVGYLPDPPSEFSLALMNDGTQRHYWWQKVGLSAGFLTDIEAKAAYEPYYFGGQLDGEGVDEHGTYGFELKSTNPTKYRQVSADDGFTPEEWTFVESERKLLTKHAVQVGGYFLARPDLERFSVVYEKRDYSVEWVEVVVTRDDVMEVTERSFTDLLMWIAHEQMPPQLPNYPKDKQCTTWCSFTSVCPNATF